MIVQQPTASPSVNLEPRIRQIGMEILERSRSSEPAAWRLDWWMNHLLNWSTVDLRRKVQLFRFVDVLPVLDEGDEVVRHLAEYLLREDVPLPGPGKRILESAAKGAFYKKQLARLTRSGALVFARRFIAGQNAEEAIQTIRRLRSQGMAFTIDILGEATTSDVQGDEYAQEYIDLMRSLAASAGSWEPVPQIDQGKNGPIPRVNISLKPSSLDPNFDPIAPESTIERMLARFRPVLREAMRLNVSVTVDMEQYKYKDLTLRAIRQVLDEPEFRNYSEVGTVIQAYLADAQQDLEQMIEWVKRRGTPITLRLVKGAYWDYETAWAIQNDWPVPVLTQKWQSDAQYEVMARRLLDARGHIRPAFASHNVRTLASVYAYAESIGATKGEFETQMLYGMGDSLKTAVAGMGNCLRVYTPYGELIPGMGYLIRRLLENTSNESFLKQSGSDREPPEKLLADPAVARPVSPPLPKPLIIDPEENADMTPFKSEPVADFSREEARQAMKDALAAVRKQLGRTYPLVIDGKQVQTESTLDSVNPSNKSEVVGRVCLGKAEHVEQAVAAARRVFEQQWLKTTARQRMELLHRAAEIMRRRRFELSAWMTLEVGKAWRESDADVAEAIDFCEFYGQDMVRLSERPRRRDFPGEENLYVYQPRGVVAVISPWNFPLAILTGMSTAALAAGNTVVMKPAGQSSVIAAKLMEIFEEAGFPAGAVNYLPCSGRDVGPRLVEHPDVEVIAFTGSREVGVNMYETASKFRAGQRALKRVVAEMGGKNAIIVDADVDVDEVVVGVLASAFGYSGQKCSACSRVIVDKSIAPQFMERLVAAAKSVPIGPAESPETIVGPVIDGASQKRILGYIEKGKQEAKLAYTADLGDLAQRGFFVPPTIFGDVPPKACIAQEEIFGPVIAVTTVNGFDEAMQVANGTEYALTGGIYSRSPAHIERAKREMYVGNLYINRKITGALVDRQPFGGFRMSGVGSKAGGPDYLLQFVEPKTITENTLRHGLTVSHTDEG